MIVTVHKSTSITEHGTNPDTIIALTRPLPTTNNLDENDALYKADAALIFDAFLEMLPRHVRSACSIDAAAESQPTGRSIYTVPHFKEIT